MERLSDLMHLENNNSLEEYSRKLYNEFISDKELLEEVKESGFTLDDIYKNIGSFHELKENRDKEKTIKSYQDCVNNDFYYRYKLIKTSYGLEKTYEATHYYREYLLYIGHFYFKDFSDEFNDVNWKDLTNKDDCKKEVNKCLKANLDIYLTGAIRSGRTFLSVALLNNYLKSDKHKESKVSFISASKRFNAIGNLFYENKEEYNNIMTKLINSDLLVIDDLGGENRNITTRDYVLKPLIKARTENNKTTIYTSDYTLNELKRLYTLKNKDPEGFINSENLIKLIASKLNHEITVGEVSYY